jgi:putative transposase
MLKAYKYRIFPTDEQKDQLQRYFGVSRLVYNLGLETKTEAYATRKKSISKYDLIRQLPELKKEFDFIKECPSQSLQSVIINLDTAYQNFFKGRGQFPKFKNKYSKQSLAFPQGYKISFKDSKITLPKLKDVAVDFHREFKGTPKTVTLSKSTTNKYFISVLVDTKATVENKPINYKDAVGVDFGIKDLAITSDGEVFENKNHYKLQQKRLRVEQRSLSRKQKGSINRQKQKLKVALLHERIRNRRKDQLHKLSKYLVNNYDTIVLEDLAVNEMVKNKNLSRAISDMGWRELRTMLEYKSKWYGKNLLTIGRFEPSSKVCSNCGSVKKDLKLSERTYVCSSCNSSMDRDINAAINIKNFGLRDKPSYANAIH